ncbi:MAG: orotate phosphoribosyltransferase [Bacteroidales bacterium]|jgi:orotate phosphoribosyltransferase|nr:orotate phosphoribosyltransferase [Bacteroidales bacterium]|tara:strand:- start:26355 stop:27008 length:654 start_codon:yes stop_codon:yes gene_type:complete
MISNKEIAENIASILLDIKAIKLSPKNPFTWASGLRSPIYCDNRIALSFPDKRTYIKEKIVTTIKEYFTEVEVIAGVATAGIPQGALVADMLGLPFVYVRSSAKSHGMTNKIEGNIEKGQRVVVIEDLVSTGKSSLDAVDALRAVNADVMGMVAIFTYGLDIAVDNFASKGCDLIALSDYNAMISKAVSEKYVSFEDEKSLLEWRTNPKNWSDSITD